MEWKAWNRFIHFYSSMRHNVWVIQYESSFFSWFFRRIIILFGVWNFSGFSWSLCRRWSSTERISRNWFINLNMVHTYESCKWVILSSPGVFIALEGVAADDFIGDLTDFAGDAPNMLFEGDFSPPGVFGSGARWPGDFGPGDFGPGVFRPGVLSPGVLWGVLSLRFNWLGLTNAGVGSGLRIVCKWKYMEVQFLTSLHISGIIMRKIRIRILSNWSYIWASLSLATGFTLTKGYRTTRTKYEVLLTAFGDPWPGPNS